MKINVLGTNYMGKQICSLFVVLYHKVQIWHNSTENTEQNLINEITKIEKYFNIKSKGDYSITNNIKDLENNLTIETVKEDILIKKEIISKLNFKNNIFSNFHQLNYLKLEITLMEIIYESDYDSINRIM